jgi:ABC-type nitrate/sulfonate/bicarbonate transport system substrate-binding protein
MTARKRDSWRLAIGLGLVGAVLLACGGGGTPAASKPAAPAAAPAAPAAPAASGSGGSAAPAAPAAAAAPASAPAAAPAMQTTRIVYTTIAAVQSPFWIAQDAGYFREQGVDPGDMIRVDPGATLLAALQNREVEFVAAGGPSLVLGNLQGIETMIFGSTLNWLETIVVARPEIRTIDDLRGKTIAVSRLKAISDLAARLGAERMGLKPDVDVMTRGTGGNAESFAALEGGTVAAASVSVPTVFEARKRGYHDLIDVTAMRIPFGNGTLGATKTMLNARLDVAERVLKATAQATSRLKTDREFAAQVIGKYTHIEDMDTLRATVDVYAPIMTVDPYPDDTATQGLLDAEEHAAARTTKPQDVTDYRAAEAVRRSGLLDRLHKD